VGFGILLSNVILKLKIQFQFPITRGTLPAELISMYCFHACVNTTVAGMGKIENLGQSALLN
jgi:hypothetical protein